MRVFKVRDFADFARDERISDEALCAAIDRAERGLVDADLYGGLIKQRVARRGQGRRGGYRVIIAYDRGRIAVFLYGFAKNERANISVQELAALRILAAAWFKMNDRQLQQALENQRDEEVDCGKED